MSNMIVKHGAPTINTAGSIGQRYFDIDSGRIYECKSNGAKIVVDDSLSHPHNFVAVNRAEAYVNEYVWEEISDGGGSAQPDWNQNDPTAPDYVKNRTHWDGELVRTVIYPELKIEHDGGSAHYNWLAVGDGELFVEGEKYEVTFDGVKYACTGFVDKPYSEHVVMLGTYNGRGESDCPFYIYITPPDYDVTFSNSMYFDFNFEVNYSEPYIHTIEVTKIVEEVHTIDPKYLPCDLMFKVGCTGFAHPKYGVAEMTRPSIVSGSLEAVLEKLANGEIPVVKVQYIGAWDKNISFPSAYGGEFVCDTWLYGTDISFSHIVLSNTFVANHIISMDLDNPFLLTLAIEPFELSNQRVSGPIID